MKNKIIILFLCSLFLFSCTTRFTEGDTDALPKANYREIFWGDCMRYGEPYSDDEPIEIYGIVIKNHYTSPFLKKIYVKSGCKYSATLNGKALNGAYILQITNKDRENDTILDEFLPAMVVATFKNGLRDGAWKYYGDRSFTSLPPEIGKALYKNYTAVPLRLLKIETYKNGLPHGNWKLFSKNKTIRYRYKNGKLIEEKTTVVK